MSRNKKYTGVVDTAKLDMSEFDEYVKDFKRAYAKVGVLGSVGDTDVETIAQYAVAHEFGVVERNLPARSFIRLPLELHMPDGVKEVRKRLKKLLEEGKVEEACAVLGMKGVEIIKKFFEDQGEGHWAWYADSTMKQMRKKQFWRSLNPKLLQDSGALLSSITSEVVVKK